MVVLNALRPVRRDGTRTRDLKAGAVTRPHVTPTDRLDILT
jgi:hypothetical protein